MLYQLKKIFILKKIVTSLKSDKAECYSIFSFFSDTSNKSENNFLSSSKVVSLQISNIFLIHFSVFLKVLQGNNL